MSGRARGAVRQTRLRLPIRLKLAVVSAGLTFAILLLFAVVVGTFTEQRLRSNFDNDIRATGSDLQERLRIQRDLQGNAQFSVSQNTTLRAASAGGATIRVVQPNGGVLAEVGNRTVDLGPPVEGLRDVGDYRVVARPLFAGSLDRSNSFRISPNPIDGAVAFVQYAKPADALDATTNRLHLFFAFGVLGGTGLAFLAGLFLAGRAMRPVTALTSAAKEVARTRDPGRPLPRSEADDEVAELADTLDEMLMALNAARGETELALERQRSFVADASHELRTPLTSILANLEMLEADLGRPEGPRDPAVAADIAGSALRSSRRMRRLVGDLLLLARADAGRETTFSPLDLSDAVREAGTEAAPLADGHPLTLDLVRAGEARVSGARDDLHRLALNLIENAFLHTPTGTPVVASVRRIDDHTVALEVSDRGPGIPEEMRERVFERFARAEGDRGPRRGSGLGLAIVRAVADAHGGSVDISEADGGGAVFTVTLPALAPREPQAPREDGSLWSGARDDASEAAS